MGGGPCIYIITGEEAQAAIDRYDASHPPRKADTTLLRRQIEASCTLSYYLSLYAATEEGEIEQTAFAPIIAFHRRIADGIQNMSATEIEERWRTPERSVTS